MLGPLARPITRMQPPQASASKLAIARAADPPPRWPAQEESGGDIDSPDANTRVLERRVRTRLDYHTEKQ